MTENRRKPDLRKLLGFAPLGSPELTRGQTLTGEPDFPGSVGDRERLKFRESEFLRLVQVAVANDDGSPIAELTDERLAAILERVSAIHELLAQPEPEPVPKSDLFDTRSLLIPGIGAGVAYTSGDAFGDKFMFGVPIRGSIENVLFYDLDDEGIAKTIALFQTNFTATADNAALSIADNDLVNLIGHIQLEAADFADLGPGRIATVRLNPSLHYYAPEGRLHCQLQTQGADNIAAGSPPSIRFWIRNVN